jgi:antitoxin (DNA-binding transcriptional repressor) of toxin-antitoxin stability system
MKVYKYSEARQRLARLLDEALAGGEVRIKRRDGSEFAVRPVPRGASPLNVPDVETITTRNDILSAIRELRCAVADRERWGLTRARRVRDRTLREW